jgi:hypothetical protein
MASQKHSYSNHGSKPPVKPPKPLPPNECVICSSPAPRGHADRHIANLG